MKVKSKQSKKFKSKKTITFIVIGVLLIVLVIILYSLLVGKDKTKAEPVFKKQGTLEFVSKNDNKIISKIDIEVADKDSSRIMGLMYRKSMEENQGMLFIFPKEDYQSFWMKNTYISLDIIYVNSDKEIVKIYKNTIPRTLKSLPSEKKSQYVIEVIGGYTDRHDIKEGDKINFEITK